MGREMRLRTCTNARRWFHKTSSKLEAVSWQKWPLLSTEILMVSSPCDQIFTSTLPRPTYQSTWSTAMKWSSSTRPRPFCISSKQGKSDQVRWEEFAACSFLPWTHSRRSGRDAKQGMSPAIRRAATPVLSKHTGSDWVRSTACSAVHTALM